MKTLLSLRDRQELAALAFWHRFYHGHGYPPSLREVCRGAGISSTSMAAIRLDALEGYGAIPPRRRRRRDA